MEEDAVRLAPRCREIVTNEPEIDGARGRIAEREAGQHAIARDGMKVARDSMLRVVEP